MPGRLGRPISRCAGGETQLQAAVVAAETLPRILHDYAELPRGLGCFAAARAADGAPVGWFALRPPSSAGLDRQASGTVEVGYRLFPVAWGYGYATEGAGRSSTARSPRSTSSE